MEAKYQALASRLHWAQSTCADTLNAAAHNCGQELGHKEGQEAAHHSGRISHQQQRGGKENLVSKLRNRHQQNVVIP